MITEILTSLYSNSLEDPINKPNSPNNEVKVKKQSKRKEKDGCC